MGSSSSALRPGKSAAMVELPAAMGKWYVIGSVLTILERGAHNAIEQWDWNEAKEQIDVTYTFHKGSPNGALTTITQRAFVHDTTTNAEWRFQPVWPLRIPFFILEIGPKSEATDGGADGGYEWIVAAVSDRSFCWIMARSPQLDDAIYQDIIDGLKEKEFDVSGITKTPQIWAAAADDDKKAVAAAPAVAPAVAEPTAAAAEPAVAAADVSVVDGSWEARC